MRTILCCISFSLLTLLTWPVLAQDPTSDPAQPGSSVAQPDSSAAQPGSSEAQPGSSVTEKVQEMEKTLNESETAKEISAGLLQPIYDLAQLMAFSWFYWSAFALMVAGLVSFALQLVLTKLILLTQMKLNIQEVLSDLLGLLISLAGLVLVTQAATQNSTFTSSPASVISAALVGVIVGFVFYIWGQRTEFRAARPNAQPPVKPDSRVTM